MASSVLGAGAGASGPGALTKGKGKGRLNDAIDLTRTSAFQPSNGARKLVIKNLRPPNPVRDAKVAQYYAQTEKDLEAALDAILAGRKPTVPFERLFRAVEDLCRKGDADRVYCALKERMEKHVYNEIMPRIKSEGGNSNYQTLKSLQAHWSTFNAQMVRQHRTTQNTPNEPPPPDSQPHRSSFARRLVTSTRRISCGKSFSPSTK